MSTVIIDYGSGNLHSALKAFERAARESGYKGAISLTSDPETVRRADRIVLPGVGAYADCKRGLDAVEGMIEALQEQVLSGGKPFLGICVGMQLMATRGLEHGETAGLGWIEADVVALEPSDPALKIPHMGWNTLQPTRDHPLLEGMILGEQGLHAYFVHSYHMRLSPQESACALTTTDYAGLFNSTVVKNNMAGSQFHPEKSQTLGLTLLANFLRWTP
jgi:imidazole glycerol-phosphate synthase subunit HisH